jgi:hypothetical protein
MESLAEVVARIAWARHGLEEFAVGDIKKDFERNRSGYKFISIRAALQRHDPNNQYFRPRNEAMFEHNGRRGDASRWCLYPDFVQSRGWQGGRQLLPPKRVARVTPKSDVPKAQSSKLPHIRELLDMYEANSLERFLAVRRELDQLKAELDTVREFRKILAIS